MNYLEKVQKENTPNHIAIIMDGNGRWAKQQGHERLYGHSIGVESVRAALSAAKQIGVKYLTIYAFSTENLIKVNLRRENRPSCVFQLLL